jgi:hypothetical protein
VDAELPVVPAVGGAVLLAGGPLVVAVVPEPLVLEQADAPVAVPDAPAVESPFELINAPAPVAGLSPAPPALGVS